MVKIELVYVASDQTTVHLNINLKSGATIQDALDESGIYLSHPETQGMPVGIYARQVPLDTILKEGDRVELYRPLARDPKEKRRQQARLKRK